MNESNVFLSSCVHVELVVVFIDDVESGCCCADNCKHASDEAAEHIQNNEGFAGCQHKHIESPHDHASDVVLLAEARVRPSPDAVTRTVNHVAELLDCQDIRQNQL